MKTTDEKYLRRRRQWSILSISIFVVVMALLTFLFTGILSPYLDSTEPSGEAFRTLLRQYGWTGRLILLGIQCLQVVIALIPGEFVELGAGYAYGAVEGTCICLLGIAISSSIIFLLVKKFGIRLVETLIPREKIRRMHFINSSSKLKRLVFLMFLIPGTPKDALTYFVGLTDMTLGQFLVITLFARIPSVVSSTVSGQLAGDENYLTAGIVYAITGFVSVAGYWIYSRYLKNKENKQ